MEVDLVFETKVRVRYGETDQMGYCYYGNYAQYFEVGRVEALRSLGLSYRKLEENGIMLPVSKFSVDYKIPALYDDELLVKTTIVSLIGPRLSFDYELVNDKGQSIAFGNTILVFVSKENMRPIKAPDLFMDVLNKKKTRLNKLSLHFY